MLACDFTRMGEDAKKMMECGADWLHMDIMDGSFVPNISFGVPVVKSMSKFIPSVFLDCHFMVCSSWCAQSNPLKSIQVVNPEKWVETFAQAGAHQFTFHMEATGEFVCPLVTFALL